MAKALVEDGKSFSFAVPQMWDQNMLFPLLDLLKPHKLLLVFSFFLHRNIEKSSPTGSVCLLAVVVIPSLLWYLLVGTGLGQEPQQSFSHANY